MKIAFTEDEIKILCHELNGSIFGMNILFRDLAKNFPNQADSQKNYLESIQKIRHVVEQLKIKSSRSLHD